MSVPQLFIIAAFAFLIVQMKLALPGVSAFMIYWQRKHTVPDGTI